MNICFEKKARSSQIFCKLDSSTLTMFRSVVFFAAVAGVSAFVPTTPSFGVAQRTVVSAEPVWTPPEGTKWEEKDFEADIKKLEEEAAERMDAKISELMGNIESTGKSA